MFSMKRNSSVVDEKVRASLSDIPDSDTTGENRDEPMTTHSFREKNKSLTVTEERIVEK